jgi:hypothetical protein
MELKIKENLSNAIVTSLALALGMSVHSVFFNFVGKVRL